MNYDRNQKDYVKQFLLIHVGSVSRTENIKLNDVIPTNVYKQDRTVNVTK